MHAILNTLILLSKTHILVNSQSIDFNVRSGCENFPENINQEKCSDERYQNSVCEINSTVAYSCGCDFSQVNSVLIIPFCHWKLIDPVSTTPEEPTTLYPTTIETTATTQFRESDCDNIQVTNGVIICDGYTGCYVACDYGFVPGELLSTHLPDLEIKVNCNIQDQHFTCLPVSDICYLDLLPYESDPLKTVHISQPGSNIPGIIGGVIYTMKCQHGFIHELSDTNEHRMRCVCTQNGFGYRGGP